MISLHQLLKAAVKQQASDLHVVAGSSPALRVDGRIMRVKSPALTLDEARQLCYSILTDAQKSRFEATKELDISFSVTGMGRFRANFFFQKGGVSGVFRRIANEVPDFDTLGLPKALKELVLYPSGMVLVTGPTGSGKSTTIASMVDLINRDVRGHIITIEDPIEYVHEHKSCIVNQREIGSDSSSFRMALRHVLRQDPDVCVLGELRDHESIDASMVVAETGHLVFATLHTNSAISTISRMVGVFPAEQQERVRVQLSFVLNAVISQRLLPATAGGMVAAVELLILNPNIRNLIRENKLHQIYGMMQVGQGKTGMITLNQSLLKLVIKRKIELQTAFSASTDPEELDKLLKQAGV